MTGREAAAEPTSSHCASQMLGEEVRNETWPYLGSVVGSGFDVMPIPLCLFNTGLLLRSGVLASGQLPGNGISQWSSVAGGADGR